MNKTTANSMQFLGRVGNSSTKPSARGVNLLGWGEPEAELSAEQLREVLVTKVLSLQAGLSTCRTKAQRVKIGKEINDLNLQVNALKGDSHKGHRDMGNFIADVVKENVPRLTWERYVNEARVRFEQYRATEQKP